MKNLLKTETRAAFLQAVNTSRIRFGRIRSSLYGERFSEYQEPRSTFPELAPASPMLARTVDTQRKVFFFHVFKTGGVTFRRILNSIYGSEFKVCYDPTAESIEKQAADARAMEFHTFQFQGQVSNMHSGLVQNQRWDLLEGHDCFTMLREPIDQTLSSYYYLVRRRLFIEPVYMARGLKFPETFDEYLEGDCHFNLQTAFLADRQQLNAETAATREDLSSAIAMLLRVRMHVGLTERFADSMNVFETVTGQRIPGDVIHTENRNPNRVAVSSISQKMRDRIRERSALDIELYRIGREMFLEDFSRCAPTRQYTFLDAPLADTVAVGVPSMGLSSLAATTGDETMTTGQSGLAKKAVFLHVMKTGGMTFRRILSSIYGDSFHVVENPEIEAVESALSKYDCVEFHTSYYQGDYVHMHSRLMTQKRWDVLAGTDIFAMFRDPVDQVISQFYYMQQQRALIEPAYLLNGVKFPETVEQYLENPVHVNNQLAFLVGKYRLNPGNDVTRDDLEMVKEMMVRLNVHAGLTERFAESLHVFETITGRKVPGGQILNQNQNAERLPLQAIPAGTKDLIRSMSSLDNELYSFARDLFMKDVALCGPTRQYTFVDTAKPALAPV